MNPIYFTVTGTNYYYGNEYFKPEIKVQLIKEPDNKHVKLQTRAYGQDLLIERNAASFEDAVSAAVDAMKEKIVRCKEKKFEA